VKGGGGVCFCGGWVVGGGGGVVGWLGVVGGLVLGCLCVGFVLGDKGARPRAEGIIFWGRSSRPGLFSSGSLTFSGASRSLLPNASPGRSVGVRNLSSDATRGKGAQFNEQASEHLLSLGRCQRK